MKAHSKVVLLVALALFLTISACTRQATPKTDSVTPTVTGEFDFPFTTPVEGAITDFGTQTAVARTPQVLIATETLDAGQGGVVAETPVPESGGGVESGGGIEPVSPADTTGAAPADAGPAVATPVVARPSTYTLQRGEWPICIARRYDLDISALFSQNGLNMNSKPAAGVTLQIPASGNWNPVYGNRSLAAHPVNYTVQSGDSVYSIACKFGDVTPEAILAVNGLSSAADLQAGTTISIP